MGKRNNIFILQKSDKKTRINRRPLAAIETLDTVLVTSAEIKTEH